MQHQKWLEVQGVEQVPGDGTGHPTMLGCKDQEVEAAIVGAHKSNDVQQPHRAEAGQQPKCQNDSSQDQAPFSAQCTKFTCQACVSA